MAEIEPLLSHRSAADGDRQSEVEEPPSPGSNSVAQSKPDRVASLDVFRGLAVLLMIIVDYGGSIFPIIAHVPWNGAHLADFVMPFFLLVAGISVAIAYKKVPNRIEATWKALRRTLELFLFGIVLQGGYLHGVNSLTYGVDIKKIRWLGILQRIAIGYIVAALCEIWLPCQTRRGGLFRNFFWQWCVALVMCAVYLGLLYGLYVPNWQFSVIQTKSSLMPASGSTVYRVNCSTRGDLGPACNSAGMIDRYILGVNHLYAKPVYRNLKECKVPQTSPAWCHAPFDPEGILSSIPAAVTCIVGLHYGHILLQMQHHKERLWNWSAFSVSLMGFGSLLAFLGMPLNKSLYTISYQMVTSAAAGITLCLLYTLVDVYGWRRLVCILEWMGKHSLAIFILVTSNIIVIAAQGYYFKSPENNIVNWIITRVVHK